MILEARRLGMRGVWLYLVFGMLIAISVTVPIFLINRELALHEREPSSRAGTFSVPDIIGLILVGAARTAYAVMRSEEHTTELQSLMRISYAVLCLKKKQQNTQS